MKPTDRRPSTMKDLFTPQYTDFSGPGSTLEFTEPYRRFLELFIFEHDVRSVADLGCGDMTVMSAVDLQGAIYLGIDVISERVRRNALQHPSKTFTCRDLRDGVPAADLILVKDVIQHWSTSDIIRWLEDLARNNSVYRFVLITNCNYGPTVNTSIETGGWRAVDLLAPPFDHLVKGEVVFQWNAKDVVLVRGASEL